MGGKILLGVTDNGTIRGEKLTGTLKAEIFSLGRNCDPPIEVSAKQVGNVVIVDVAAGDEKPYSCAGSYYKRFDAVTQKLNRDETKTLFETIIRTHFDEKLSPKATINDLSLAKIRAFIKETGKQVSVSKATLPLLLESLKLIEENKITHAGVMIS